MNGSNYYSNEGVPTRVCTAQKLVILCDLIAGYIWEDF